MYDYNELILNDVRLTFWVERVVLTTDVIFLDGFQGSLVWYEKLLL